MSEQPDPAKVICPNCVHQFRAIPVDVQDELARLRAAPTSEEVQKQIQWARDGDNQLLADLLESLARREAELERQLAEAHQYRVDLDACEAALGDAIQRRDEAQESARSMQQFVQGIVTWARTRQDAALMITVNALGAEHNLHIDAARAASRLEAQQENQMTTITVNASGRTPFSLENGGTIEVIFNTGKGVRGGAISVFMDSTGMLFGSWSLLDLAGQVLREGQNAATPRVLFEAEGSLQNPGHLRVKPDTNYKLKATLNPVDNPGPFGGKCDLNQLQPPH